MKNKGAKQKLKRKGAASAFGCDLTEYLESSGQDVPYVLKSCAEFIETHGIVDGIYRLSGVTSNIQRLRRQCRIALKKANWPESKMLSRSFLHPTIGPWNT